MATATIKMFLVHGDPKRLRTAEISNWTGKAVAGPRSEFDGVLGREESEKSGVYFLTGTDPESGRPAIYVGEAERHQGSRQVAPRQGLLEPRCLFRHAKTRT